MKNYTAEELHFYQNSKSNSHFNFINNSLESFFNGSNTSYGTLKNDASREIDSWSHLLDHSNPNKASSNLEKRILQYMKPNADRQLNLAGIFNIAGIVVSIN